MKDILSEIIAFIKNPKDERIEDYTLKKNIKYVLFVFCMDVLLNIFLFIPLLYLIDSIEPLITELRIDYTFNTFASTLLFIGILIPIIEEVLFRSWLRYNTLVSSIFSKSRWDKIFKYLVYTSIIVFGLVHSSNYLNHSLFFYFTIPFIVATQTIGGILFTFIRVKFNLISSILLHSTWNTGVIVLAFLFTHFEKPYIQEDKAYHLIIESQPYNTTNPSVFTIDTAANKIYRLSTKEYSINHTLDSLFKHNRYGQDYLINIEFESKEGLDIEKFKALLLDYDNKK